MIVRVGAAAGGAPAALALALGGLVAVCVACPSAEGRALGELCSRSADCVDGLECVERARGGAICVPEPATRAARSCRSATDCTLGDVGWPTEALCEPSALGVRAGACVCPDDTKSCGDRTFDPDTCLCR